MSAKNAAFFLTIYLLSGLGVVHAQTAGIVTLRADSTSASGSMVPVLTWSTNPTATSCSASGGWSGNKAIAGTQTLPAISASTNYTLTCSWGTGSSTVSWVAPTANSDGTTLTNLAGYRVYYGTSSTNLSQTSTIDNMAATSAVISPLAAGTWYFKVRALNTSQVESADSNIATKVVAGASAASTVSITITAPPPPPPPPPPPTTTLKTTSTSVYDVVWYNGARTRGRYVGSIALGKPCQASYRVGSSYYKVTHSDVTFTRTSRSNSVIARCATS